MGVGPNFLVVSLDSSKPIHDSDELTSVLFHSGSSQLCSLGRFPPSSKCLLKFPVLLQLSPPALVARQAQHDWVGTSARQRRLPPPFVRSALRLVYSPIVDTIPLAQQIFRRSHCLGRIHDLRPLAPPRQPSNVTFASVGFPSRQHSSQW